MLAGSELVQIDEDDLLKELDALKSNPVKEMTNLSVENENIIEIEGEDIELPSVPKDAAVKILEPLHEREQEEDLEKKLIAQ